MTDLPHLAVVSQGNCLGAEYVILAASGTVMANQCKHDTQVSGGPAVIYSTTKITQTVFLQTGDGSEITLHFSGF